MCTFHVKLELSLTSSFKGYLFFFFFWIELRFEFGLTLNWQVLYQLSHTCRPSFHLVFFRLCFCLGLASDSILLPIASCVADITGVYHHAWLIDGDGVSITCCLGWSRTAIFSVSTSQVAGITGVNHHTYLGYLTLYLNVTLTHFLLSIRATLYEVIVDL
jgi:hypothetical protein